MGALLYVAGGVGYAVKAHGAAFGPGAHPHRERWAELAGLVVDGLKITTATAKAKLGGGGGGGGGRGGDVKEHLTANLAADPERASAEAVQAVAAAVDDSGDEIIE
jgi:hypothetical protein